MKPDFDEYFDSNPEHFAAVTTSMIHWRCWNYWQCETDLFTSLWIYIVRRTASLTDASGTTENMSAGTDRYGYSSILTIGATESWTQARQQLNTNVYMGRSIMQTLSKYIDEVLMLNRISIRKSIIWKTISIVLLKNKRL